VCQAHADQYSSSLELDGSRSRRNFNRIVSRQKLVQNCDFSAVCDEESSAFANYSHNCADRNQKYCECNYTFKQQPESIITQQSQPAPPSPFELTTNVDSPSVDLSGETFQCANPGDPSGGVWAARVVNQSIDEMVVGIYNESKLECTIVCPEKITSSKYTVGTHMSISPTFQSVLRRLRRYANDGTCFDEKTFCDSPHADYHAPCIKRHDLDVRYCLCSLTPK